MCVHIHRSRYHNGRGTQFVNHGLHAFSTDGTVWHKPSDALHPACASHEGVDGVRHNCGALYDNKIIFADGTSTMLEGRERPALLFDPETGAPSWLFNGGISANRSVPWFAMAQGIL